MKKFVLVIIGCGVMGQQVALWAAGSGMTVIAIDSNPAFKDRALGFFQTMHHRFPVATEHKSMLSRIQLISGELSSEEVRGAISSADAIWEFTPEVLTNKRKLLEEISECAKQDALILSGTSSIPASELFTGLKREQQMVKLHPFAFFPFHLPMVELVQGQNTSAQALETAWEFSLALQVVPFEISTDPVGQGMNRLWELIKEEVARGLAENRYRAEEIDAMFRIFTGMFAGPAGLMDMVGLNTVCQIMGLYTERRAGLLTEVPDPILELASQAGGKFYQGPDPWRKGPLQVRHGAELRTLPFLLPNQLAGEWELTEMIAIGPENQVLYRPFGENPSGKLTYGKFGTVCVHLQRNDISQLDAAIPEGLRQIAETGFVHYSGQFWIEADNVLHRTRDGFPAMMRGQILSRKWMFDEKGNLVLDTPPGQYGQPDTRIRLTWKFSSPV